MIPAFARPVTTVTTEKKPVVTGQPIGNNGCHDRHDRHDQNAVENGQKRKSLNSLVERLRQRREKTEALSRIDTRQELTNPSEQTYSEPHIDKAVVPVVTVVTPFENNGLDDFYVPGADFRAVKPR